MTGEINRAARQELVTRLLLAFRRIAPTLAPRAPAVHRHEIRAHALRGGNPPAGSTRCLLGEIPCCAH